jgi:AraC family transcriptional regulator
VTQEVAESYAARFRRVLEYIDAHLDEDLGLDTLCAVAGFSKFHFHRQFTALFAVTLHPYVQMRRLKRAAHRLAFRGDAPILDIALESGYEGPEAFARAFRKAVGQSPSQFRRDPQWESWYARYQPVADSRSRYMTPRNRADDVRIVDFPETRVALLTHQGDPQRIGDSVRRFIEWRKQNQLPPRVSATFNLVHEDPATADPAQYRLGLCCATERPVAANPSGVEAAVIPGGRCAVLRHAGSDDTLAQTVFYLYREWLPASGEALRDFPLYFQRVKFFPDVPEHEAVTDVFFPLR